MMPSRRAGPAGGRDRRRATATDIGNAIFDMEALIVANCLFVEVLNPLRGVPGPGSVRRAEHPAAGEPGADGDDRRAGLGDGGDHRHDRAPVLLQAAGGPGVDHASRTASSARPRPCRSSSQRIAISDSEGLAPAVRTNR